MIMKCPNLSIYIKNLRFWTHIDIGFPYFVLICINNEIVGDLSAFAPAKTTYPKPQISKRASSLLRQKPPKKF